MKKFTENKSYQSNKKINENNDPTYSDKWKEMDGIAMHPEKGMSNNLEITKSEPSKFFSKLFESREMSHIYHLQVKGDEGSNAAHLALEQYYKNIPELIDELVETYTGQYEIVENYEIIDTSSTKKLDKLEYFNEVTKFIKETRYKYLHEEDTHLQNIIDEIVGMIYRTIYKLKYTK